MPAPMPEPGELNDIRAELRDQRQRLTALEHENARLKSNEANQYHRIERLERSSITHGKRDR